jgi:putative Holliday junction resolvase
MNNVHATEIDGPVLALDLGSKRIGAAVSDRLLISITPLSALARTNWKRLLQDVTALARKFDAKILVIGLPLTLNGKAGDAAEDVRREARKFALSLEIPVFLQDERLSSNEAAEHLRTEGFDRIEARDLVDSRAAAIILRDFLEPGQQRTAVRSS